MLKYRHLHSTSTVAGEILEVHPVKKRDCVKHIALAKGGLGFP